MEGHDVYKIYLMAVFAADLLAGCDFGAASLSDSLASDAPFPACRDNCERVFPVHQGIIYVPRQSPGRLK